MLKFLFQKYIFRFSFILTYCAIIAVFVYAFMREMNPTPIPDKAPFSSDNSVVQSGWNIPLDKPYLSHREMESYATQIATEVLTLDGINYYAQVRSAKKYFTDTGHRQYSAYLSRNNMLRELQRGGLALNSFVDESAILLNEGVFGGIYQWAYEVPITLSYRSSSRSNDNEPPNIINRRVYLNLEFKRIPFQSEDKKPLKIDNWSVRSRR